MIVLCAGTLGVSLPIHSAPFSHTLPATPINASNATLCGFATPNGSPTAAWFEWGTNEIFSASTPAMDVGSGTAVVHVSAPVSGLQQRELYRFRLVCSNETGVTVGYPQQFTTGQKLATWGGNASGERAIPSGLSNAVGIAAGDSFSLVVDSDQNVHAWPAVTLGVTGIPASLGGVTHVAAGRYHSLALKADGTLLSWGQNAYGLTNLPADLSNVVAIAANGFNSAALKADGTVVVWGQAFNGETNVPAGLSNVVAIATGNYCLALKADGTVTSWGSNSSGQTNVPDGLTNVVRIAALGATSFAVKKDGAIAAWGNSGFITNIPAGLSNVIQIDGEGHVVALKANGTVAAWAPSSTSLTNVPADLTNIWAVAAGGSHDLVIAPNVGPHASNQVAVADANNDQIIRLAGFEPNGDPMTFQIASLPSRGALYQYANGFPGDLIQTNGTPVTDAEGRVLFAPLPGTSGQPYTTFTFTASDGELQSAPATITVNVRPFLVFTKPATHIRTNAAVLNGMASPRGYPSVAWFESTRLGTLIPITTSTPPTPIGSGNVVTHIKAPLTNLLDRTSYQYRLVVSNEVGISRGIPVRFATRRRLLAWGNNESGQTTLPAGLTNVVAVDGGTASSFALKADGTVAAWGSYLWHPPGLTNIIAIASGGNTVIGLRENGTIAHGLVLNPPGAISNVVAIALGEVQGLALHSNGTLSAWGDYNYGLSAVPPGLSNVVAIACGSYHNLALKADGTVTAWGAGWSSSYSDFIHQGQSIVPAGLSNVVAISAGRAYSLALRADGTLSAWGGNGVGPGTVPNFLPPDTIAIAAGGGHWLAQRSNGVMYSWGNSSYGLDTQPTSLTNIVALGPGGNHNLVLGSQPPTAPFATTPIHTGYVNRDLVRTFTASDPNGDFLSFRIITLPTNGMLFHYNAGARGAAVTDTNTLLVDPNRSYVFGPTTNTFGDPYTEFRYVADDGDAESGPSKVIIKIILPPAPQMLGSRAGMNSNQTFRVDFSGQSNALYRVWASTNLVDWEVVGDGIHQSSNRFWFIDADAALWPNRFYRAGAP